MEHNIGFALSENYADDGKHNNIVQCGFPFIDAVPDDMTVIHCENPRKENALGSIGCAEGFQSGGHVSVINAIANACGVRVYDLPATPDKIKAGLEIIQAGGTTEPPEKYFLGSDLIEELQDILANPV
jgi:aldehyde oxidoreductase